MVKAFGLAHARLFENESGRVLVLDSLPSADAPAVQTVFQGEIWGRHAYQVQRILIPFLILLAAMACCSHLLARSVSGPGFRFFHLHRGTAPPPVALWVALFLGGCFAAWSVEQPAVHGTFALLPLIVSVFAGVAVAAQSHPNASTLVRAFEMLSACRWFWLGFLALSPEGLFRYEGVSDGPRPLGFSLAAVAAVFLLLALLHWVTSSPRSLDLQRCSGDSEAMRSRLERLNLLAIQELLLLFPAVLMATAVSSVRIESLTAYLLASITCAALMRWSMQPPKGGWAFRAFTILLVALPGSGQVREVFSNSPALLVGWLMLLGVGLLLSRSPGCPTAVHHDPDPSWKPTWSSALMGSLALGLLATALLCGLHLPVREPAQASAQAQLSKTFGHQARLVLQNGQGILVGCNLDVGQLSLAAEIVSAYLPDTETRVVSVRTRRWERIGSFFLALTVALFLVCPTYLLTFAAPGACPPAYIALCALIGGANGAFAVGAALGWFWMDPVPFLAAFLLSSSLSWFGFGYARAWIDSRILADTSRPGLAAAPNTSA
jgi:hypothetical protein